MKYSSSNCFAFCISLLPITLAGLAPHSAYAQNSQLTQCIQGLMEQEAQSDEALALCKDRQRDRGLDLPSFLSELSTEPTPIPRFTPLLDGINASQGKAPPEVLDFANRFSKEQREMREAWLKDLTTKIESKWIPPKKGSSRKTIVTFIVRRDGNIENPRISEPSGDDLTDRAALEAVQDASPFAPLPEFFPDSVTVNFSFNIYVRHQ